ncbi:MAG: energy-coupling factor ABC transporter ATP-binding protein [Campylobacteraceae bacterium]
MSLYKIENLKQIYTNKPVLDISHLEIKKGEILGIVGSNGSGKSTLLRHLAFLEKEKSGTLEYKGFGFSNIPLHVKREISILLSEPYLLKRSVKENLLYGLSVRDDKKSFEDRVHEVMSLVGLNPAKFLHRAWHELSSGEKQRVAFGARLILKPEVLLLDEPTNSLDFSGIPEFSNAIMHANKEWGTTFVIATHDLGWLSTLANRKIGLHFGKLIEFSTTNLLLGKWHESEKSISYTFGDNQKITFLQKRQIGEQRGVAINPRDIKISSNDNFKSGITLKAIIKEISYFEKTDEMSIKVSIGNTLLECIKQSSTFQKDKLFPSQSVYINFKENDVKNM